MSLLLLGRVGLKYIVRTIPLIFFEVFLKLNMLSKRFKELHTTLNINPTIKVVIA